MGFVPTGHRQIKSRHFYQPGDKVFSSEVNSEMFTEVKYQTKFILNKLPLVEGIIVDYHTRKKISPETNVEDDNFCQSVVIYHNPLH